MIRRLLAWRPRWWRDAVAVIDGAPMPSDDYYAVNEPEGREWPTWPSSDPRWNTFLDNLREQP